MGNYITNRLPDWVLSPASQIWESEAVSFGRKQISDLAQCALDNSQQIGAVLGAGLVSKGLVGLVASKQKLSAIFQGVFGAVMIKASMDSMDETSQVKLLVPALVSVCAFAVFSLCSCRSNRHSQEEEWPVQDEESDVQDNLLGSGDFRREEESHVQDSQLSGRVEALEEWIGSKKVLLEGGNSLQKRIDELEARVITVEGRKTTDEAMAAKVKGFGTQITQLLKDAAGFAAFMEARGTQIDELTAKVTKLEGVQVQV